MQNTELVFGNSMLLIFVIIEALITVFYFKEKLPWKELMLNLNSGHILLWIFRGIEVAAYYYTITSLNLHLITALPYWLQWILAFLLWDFMFYWLHRTHHYFSILWSVHVVHHEGEHFSLSLGIRNSWYSSLTSFPYFIVLAVIGVPVEIFVAVSSIHYFIQFYNHNHFVRKSGWLDYILVTPKHHRVHHGKNDPYIDKNFGGTLLLWDKLFGTFQEELAENPVQYGTSDPVESFNPILVNNIPFAKMAGKFNALRNKFKPLHVPIYQLVSGALLLFLMLLFFIYFEKSWKFQPKAVLFSLVFLGTIGNGLMSDGRRIGIALWLTITIVFPLIFWLFFPVELIFFHIVLTLLVAHGLLVLLTMKSYQAKDKVNEFNFH